MAARPSATARARHARLAGQDRAGHRASRRWRWRGGSSATRTGAAEDARRLADDARQATREAREIIVGLRGDADDGGCRSPPRSAAEARALGRRRPAIARRAGRSRTSASSTRGRARARVDPARGAGQRRAHAQRDHASTSTCGALGERVVLTIADDGRRLRGARRPRGAAPSGPLRPHRHARARAARRRRPERRVGARRGLRALGVGAGEARPARQPRGPGPPPGAAPAVPSADEAASVPCRLHVAMIRVLLVDDNAIVRRGIASPARRGRRASRSSARPATAARRSRSRARRSPDVVCLDVRMPVMDGVAAAGPLSREARRS